MVEKIKEFAKKYPWAVGIMLALPVVLIFYFLSRRGGTPQYEPTGMIYQPPAGGGSGGGVTGGGGSDVSSIANMMTDMMGELKNQQDAQMRQMGTMLQAQAEAQSRFLETQQGMMQNMMQGMMQGLSSIQEQTQRQLQGFMDSMQQSQTLRTQTVLMPQTQSVVETRNIYTPSGQRLSVPSGRVSVADMPGTTEDARWAMFEQTVAYDYLSDVAKEAQRKVQDYGAKWASTSNPQERKQIHQQAQAERQRVYQEITRGGAGFQASWVDTGQGYSQLSVRTPEGKVIRI